MSLRVGAKTKGWIKNNVSGAKLSFQFNPTSLSHNRGAVYVDISAPGMAYPNTQFVKGGLRNFPVTLYVYDKPYSGLVNNHINFLESFLPPETNTSDYSKPPDMTFCYGYFIKKCVLENLDTLIEEIDSNGRPLVATFNLQLRQVGV